MYVGRIVAVGSTPEGRLTAMYRVSSRSFPNRTARVQVDRVSIVPKPGHEMDVFKNPYIAYNCLRIVRNGTVAVMTNGSHTDPIAEKIDHGMPARDALVLSMIALDYERDSYNTPRISAVVDKEGGLGWLGVIRHDGLEVERIPLDYGRLFYVATYEENTVTAKHHDDFPAVTAEAACHHLLEGGVFAQREHPVTAVSAMAADEGFTIHVMDAQTGVAS